MGANEGRHVLEMVADLGKVLALELYTAAQALDYRQDMLNAARRLASRGDWRVLAGKIANAPDEKHASRAQFETEVQATSCTRSPQRTISTRAWPCAARTRRSASASRSWSATARMDGDVKTICEMIAERGF